MGTIPKKNANDARASHPEPNHFPSGKEPVEMAMFSAPRSTAAAQASERSMANDSARRVALARTPASRASRATSRMSGSTRRAGPTAQKTHHGSQGVQDEVVHVEQAVGVLVKAPKPG